MVEMNFDNLEEMKSGLLDAGMNAETHDQLDALIRAVAAISELQRAMDNLRDEGISAVILS